jgi:RimJ/RimL family protein N-acetyltransferase
MKNPFLVGRTLYLRPPETGDAALTAACTNSVEARESFFTHTPVSLEAERHRLEDLGRPGGDCIPLVICPLGMDEGIGLTAFHRVDLVSRAAVFSICIPAAGHWGKGFGTETTCLMLSYGFDILNLHRVQLHVWAENTRAIRAYEKAGFVREGLLREAMKHHGKYCDFLVMGILEPEWRARSDSPAGRGDTNGG